MQKALTKDHFILNAITYFQLKKITKIIKSPKFYQRGIKLGGLLKKVCNLYYSPVKIDKTDLKKSRRVENWYNCS